MKRTMVVAAILMISGCVSPIAAEDRATVDPAAVPTQGEPVTVSQRFEFEGEVRTPVWSFGFGSTPSVDFAGDANTTSIVLEARWECQSPTCGFILYAARDGKVIASSRGEQEARVVVESDELAGAWEGFLVADVPVVLNVRGDLRATLFSGPLPPGWSAYNIG